MKLHSYLGYKEIPLSILGPDFNEKNVPTLLYFSLSAEESLTLAPYNQIAQYLAGANCRVLSVTLPGHHEGQDKYEAMKYWAHHLEELDAFLESMFGLLDHLFEKSYIETKHFALAGLSRGGYIATYLLSHPKVKTALGYAPVTDLSHLLEFKSCDPKALERLSLFSKMDQIYNKKLRYYIGNRDLKVGTTKACHFVAELSDFAYHKKIRSPQIELIISPSVGLMGHGTLPPVFQEGAQWIEKQIVQ